MIERRVFLIRGENLPLAVISGIISGIDPTALIKKTSTGIEIEISSNKKSEIEKVLLKWSINYHLEFYLLQWFYLLQF